MAHFDQRPATAEAVNPAIAARNARYGLALFAVYGLLYGAFMLLNAFAPAVMAWTVLGGVSVAVLSGLGLIAAAFVLALVYAWLCRAPQAPPDPDAGGGQ